MGSSAFQDPLMAVGLVRLAGRAGGSRAAFERNGWTQRVARLLDDSDAGTSAVAVTSGPGFASSMPDDGFGWLQLASWRLLELRSCESCGVRTAFSGR